jgi:S-DNA-T family DNA segregation ATPase FtsK/SpoIIIE
MTEPLLGRVRELGTAGLILSGDAREGILLADERAALRPPGRGVLVRRKHPRAVIQLALPENDNENAG